ncbi:MAG: sugar phosphate isomerase/epimerase [Oscillospiraceae bacterium]|nr:sugar phosphate isomerase/epimerase [Oscillospiraceae bacterium]
MLVSTQTHIFGNKFGEHDAVKFLARAGFDALDYSMFKILDNTHPTGRDDYRDYAKSLKKTAEENNIIFRQAHAPFPSYIQEPENKNQEYYNEIIVHAIVRAIEIISILGGKIIVVHPITLLNCDYRKQKDFNIDFFNTLLPYCKKFNIKIALENMWTYDENAKKVTPGVCSPPHEFVDYLDSLDKNYFTACLDLGHAEMRGSGAESAVDLINALGSERLGCLHIHDNDKISDLHDLPFTQKLNWNEIMRALKNINYSGDFTFEADNFIEKFPAELYLRAAEFMLDTGRYFVGKYFKDF